MSNAYEGAARFQNAQRIFAHFQARGIKSTHLANMHPQILAHHIASAGVREPSDATLSMVHTMLQRHEASQTTQLGGLT